MPHRPTHVEPRQLVRQCLVAKRVLAAFARTAFCYALGMSVSSMRADETAQIDVASRIDYRQHVPQRCALSKRISFRHCEKQCVSVFHVTSSPIFTCPFVLFIGAVLGSTQLLHCSIYLSACRHIASNHVRICCSVIPLALVRHPLVFFILRISTCSIIRSVDKPAHARSLLLATCGPSTKC